MNKNELRGIDFDFPVDIVNKEKNNVMCQMCKLDEMGKPYFGSYFFDSLNEDISKLGIGDFNRITKDGRVKVEVILDENIDFLKSKSATIEDWTGTGEVFDGGGNQFYNATAKQKIKSYRIIKYLWNFLTYY